MFTWREARRHGYSAWQIRARVEDGRWRPILGPVLAMPGVQSTPWIRDRAAYLAAGESPVLSGPSAARLHGMEVRSPFACVTVPRGRHLELDGVRILRESVASDALVLIEDMFVTEKARTVVDCLRLLPEREAVTLLDRALQKRWITIEQLARRVATHRAGGERVGSASCCVMRRPALGRNWSGVFIGSSASRASPGGTRTMRCSTSGV